jgi:hypothetical protein
MMNFSVGKSLNRSRGQALHEGRGVGVEVVRAGGVEAGVAAGADVHHGRDVVLDHLLVDGVPVAVAQRRAGPVAARRVGVEVDGHVAVLLDALHQFGDAGLGSTPGLCGSMAAGMKWSGNSCATR